MLSRAKSFVQQQLPWPNQALRGQKEGGGDGAEEARLGEKLKAGGRATQILLSKSRSFEDQLPRPTEWTWPQQAEQQKGERVVRRSTNLGPPARAASLAEQLHRPRQIVHGRTREEDEGKKAGDGHKEEDKENPKKGHDSDGTAGQRAVKARSVPARLLSGGGRARALRIEGNCNGDGGGGSGEKGKSTSRGPVTKALSFMDRLPRPKLPRPREVLQGKMLQVHTSILGAFLPKSSIRNTSLLK